MSEDITEIPETYRGHKNMADVGTIEEWRNAKNHLDEVVQSYKDLIGMSGVNPFFGLSYLNSLLVRYNKGERTMVLLTEIQVCE